MTKLRCIYSLYLDLRRKPTSWRCTWHGPTPCWRCIRIQFRSRRFEPLKKKSRFVIWLFWHFYDCLGLTSTVLVILKPSFLWGEVDFPRIFFIFVQKLISNFKQRLKAIFLKSTYFRYTLPYP